MTDKEAIWRIREHMVIHKLNEPQAIKITEALELAISALEDKSQGEWITTDETDEFYGRVYKCTHCGKGTLACSCRNFCPFCGADMRKGEKTNEL